MSERDFRDQDYVRWLNKEIAKKTAALNAIREMCNVK